MNEHGSTSINSLRRSNLKARRHRQQRKKSSLRSAETKPPDADLCHHQGCEGKRLGSWPGGYLSQSRNLKSLWGDMTALQKIKKAVFRRSAPPTRPSKTKRSGATGRLGSAMDLPELCERALRLGSAEIRLMARDDRRQFNRLQE